MALKFLDSNGNGYTSDAIRCMSYALQMGALVTLNSWGGYGANSQALQVRTLLAHTMLVNMHECGPLHVYCEQNLHGGAKNQLTVGNMIKVSKDKR